MFGLKITAVRPAQVQPAKYCEVCKSFDLDTPTAEAQQARQKDWLGRMQPNAPAGVRMPDTETAGPMECLVQAHRMQLGVIKGLSVDASKKARKLADQKLRRGAHELAKQAGLGCTTCTMLLEVINIALEDEGPRFKQHLEAVTLKRCLPGAAETQCILRVKADYSKLPSRKQNDYNAFQKWVGRNVIGVTFWKNDVELLTARGSKPPYRALQSALPTRLDSAECFAKLSAWLQDCVNHHAKCAVLFDSTSKLDPELPTRVLDVSCADAEHACNLYITSPGERGKYAALSHCWGKTLLLRTTTASMDTHLKGIETAQLSKSFQDAIRITRELGVRFLWIDSLCIIQDDEDDWAREAARMANVYGGAHITIAMTSAADGSHGGLRERDARMAVALKTRSGLSARLKSRHVFADLLSWHQDPSSNDSTLQDFPLFTRKWCFQERMLSRRIIHYTNDELVWECLTEAKCECQMGARKRDGWLGIESPWTKLNAKTEFADYIQGLHEKKNMLMADTEPREIYTRFVKEFGQRQLTFQTDILSAFSGVAQVFASAGMRDYRAGIWTDYLPELLLWQVRTSGSEVREPSRPARFCAPSWSWASVDASIEFERPLRVSGPVIAYADVVSIECELESSDKYGRVRSGLLKLSADFVTCKVSSGQLIPLDFDQWNGEPKCVFDTKEDLASLEGRDVWLPLLYKGPTSVQCFWCLILRRSDSNDTFQRVGTLKVFSASLEEVFKRSRRTEFDIY